MELPHYPHDEDPGWGSPTFFDCRICSPKISYAEIHIVGIRSTTIRVTLEDLSEKLDTHLQRFNLVQHGIHINFSAAERTLIMLNKLSTTVDVELKLLLLIMEYLGLHKCKFSDEMRPLRTITNENSLLDDYFQWGHLVSNEKRAILNIQQLNKLNGTRFFEKTSSNGDHCCIL